MCTGRDGPPMSAEDEETARRTVKTYVPEYQKEIWKREASELDMSQSEFVRSMVQAGREKFEADPVETRSGDATPRGKRLKTEVLSILATEGPLSYQELLEQLIADFESELDSVLTELQAENRIQHSGRDGGYRVLEDQDE